MKKVAIAIVMVAMGFSANGQVIKSGLLKGYKEGDRLEKAVYKDKKDPINQDAWCGAFTNNPVAEFKSPVVGEALTYPGYAEGGPSIKFGGFPEGVKGARASVYSLDSGKKYSKGTLYLSCLVNFSKLGAGGFADVFGLSASYVGGGERGKVYVAREGRDKIRFAVALIKDRAEAPMAYDYDKTHLIVLKIDYTRNDASLFVNPDLSAEEPTADAVANGGEDVLKHAIRSISVRNRTGYVGNVGNFRLANSWPGVVAQ